MFNGKLKRENEQLRELLRNPKPPAEMHTYRISTETGTIEVEGTGFDTWGDGLTVHSNTRVKLYIPKGHYVRIEEVK